MTAVWGGECNTVRATKWTVRPSVAHSSAMTNISDNDTSCRSASKTIETGGVPAVCVAFGQATVLWGYDSCANSNSKYPPLSGVRGKYGKIKSKSEVMGRLCVLQSLPIVVVLMAT